MGTITLEDRIAAELKSFDGKMGIYVNDLKGTEITNLKEEPFETASTIKTFILLTLFKKVKEGKVNLQDSLTFKEDCYVDGSGILRAVRAHGSYRIHDLATWMIIVSDNVATNILIDFLGQEEINCTIQEFGFQKTVLHNPIHFEKYDQLGTTTPGDYGEFFRRLAKRELLGEKWDEEMLAIFKQQHYRSGLTKEFPIYFLDSEDTGEEELIKIYSKSGSMDACRNDGGIIETPFGSYVIVLFTKDFKDPLYYDDHPSIRHQAKVSRLIFDTYLALEGTLKK